MVSINFKQHVFSIALAAGLAGVLAGCPASQPGSGVQRIGNATAVAPEDAAAADPVFPKEAFRASQPEATQPRSFNLPGIVQFKLAEQIDVYLVERHQLPTISMELNFDGGEVNDRKGREGTASICMSMLSEGTKKLDKLAFEEALADVASNVSSYAGSESQGVSMSTLSKNFDATFALFQDSIINPGFRKTELERMVKRTLESLKQRKGSPGSVAGRLISNIIYGSKHPFGAITTERSLSKIKINDCANYHRSYIKPKGARLFVVGDMTQEQITAKFTPLLAKWKGSPRKVAALPAPKSRAGRIFFVNIPGAAQSSVYITHMGPQRLAPEFFANQAMSGVLGGGFSSRINMNLREDKGYSYGARGRFSYNRHYGTFGASSSVRGDVTHQSLLEIFDEMQTLKSGQRPAKNEELSREKNGSILGLPARFATARQVLSQYRRLVYYDLPMNYYDSYVDKVSAVSLEQVTAAASKLLHPENAIILVVGDGTSKQLLRTDGKDTPKMRIGKDGKEQQVTLLEALGELAASEIGGKGKLVILDADGKVLK